MNNVLVIMQGIPGSGKGHTLKTRLPEAYICSADDYFRKLNPNYDKGGEGFDWRKLGEAHGQCFDKACVAMESGKSVVAIDNTNLDDVGMASYIAVGKRHGYDIRIMRVYCDPKVAAARNTHGVPEAAYDRMNKAFNAWKLNRIWSDIQVVEINNNPTK